MSAFFPLVLSSCLSTEHHKAGAGERSVLGDRDKRGWQLKTKNTSNVVFNCIELPCTSSSTFLVFNRATTSILSAFHIWWEMNERKKPKTNDYNEIKYRDETRFNLKVRGKKKKKRKGNRIWDIQKRSQCRVRSFVPFLGSTIHLSGILIWSNTSIET